MWKQTQTAVAVHLKSKQLLLFAFAHHSILAWVTRPGSHEFQSVTRGNVRNNSALYPRAQCTPMSFPGGCQLTGMCYGSKQNAVDVSANGIRINIVECMKICWYRMYYSFVKYWDCKLTGSENMAGLVGDGKTGGLFVIIKYWCDVVTPGQCQGHILTPAKKHPFSTLRYP